MNAGKGHQAPRKAAHSLRKEVGQNIKDKKRDKRVRGGDPFQEGSHEGEVSKHQETLSPEGLWGSFGIPEGNIIRRKERKKKKKTHRIHT